MLNPFSKTYTEEDQKTFDRSEERRCRERV